MLSGMEKGESKHSVTRKKTEILMMMESSLTTWIMIMLTSFQTRANHPPLLQYASVMEVTDICVPRNGFPIFIHT